MRSDWLFKLRIFFAIYLRATCAGFVPEDIVIDVGINDLKSFFVPYYLTVLAHTKTSILQCRWLGSRRGKYPLAISISVNNC